MRYYSTQRPSAGDIPEIAGKNKVLEVHNFVPRLSARKSPGGMGIY